MLLWVVLSLYNIKRLRKSAFGFYHLPFDTILAGCNADFGEGQLSISVANRVTRPSKVQVNNTDHNTSIVGLDPRIHTAEQLDGH